MIHQYKPRWLRVIGSDRGGVGSMLSHRRFYLALVVCCLLAAAAAFGVAVSSGHRSSGGGAVEPVSASVGLRSLSVPGVQSLDGGQQEVDGALADRAAPAAVWARVQSRTEFERLGAGEVSRVLRRFTPAVVAKPSSGVGSLPGGVRVSHYLDDHTARLSLPGGRHALVETLAPIATHAAGHDYEPVDLDLHEAGQSFVADNASAPASIPKALSDGVTLSDSDVSLTPVTNARALLQRTGHLDGSAVVYANTAEDSDTAIKPIASGIEVYGILRSIRSPQTLSYRLGLPEGASLVAGKSGVISVLDAGRTLAVIPPSTATDASGAPVPVSTRLSDGTLQLTVAHRAAEYRYPITVDPTVIDSNLTSFPTNWRFEREGENISTWHKYDVDWEFYASAAEPNEWGALLYPTQGESHIYELSLESSANLEYSAQEVVGILGGAGWEAYSVLPEKYATTTTTVCVAVGCSSSGGTGANLAAYWLTSTGENTWGKVVMNKGSVYIAQANGPTIAADTTKERDGAGLPNVFYGSGGWLSVGKSAADFDESDPGVGVSEVQYTDGTKKWTEKENCNESAQCPPSVSTSFAGSGLPEGESTLEARAFDSMGSSTVLATKLKVDEKAPYEISLSGLPSGNEIDDSTRSLKLVAKARDGVSGTPSSGIASFKLTVNGREVGSPNGQCSPGPCVASGEWTINGEEFGAGKDTFTVTATDAAGNAASSEMTVTDHHSAPVSFGPGTLNPITGEFDLEETDASVATIKSPLTVTRSYSSREPTAGSGGVLGAPWSMSFGGAQELIRLANSNVTLVAVNGSETTFVYKGLLKFESPVGDESMVLSINPAETEYKLTDKGTSTTFRNVTGDNSTVYRPAVTSTTTGVDTTQYTYKVVGGVLRVTQVLAAVPVGVSCAPSLKPGCRALTFNYASSTTATGEGPSEWGDYTGRLTRVYFATAKEDCCGDLMPVTETVVQYAYDSRGRLRAVWDPGVSPALKTTYGYDAEGHLTVISRPGKQPSVVTYGTTVGDTGTGRAVKLMRPAASTSLWAGAALSNTVAPVLSGSAVVGVRMASTDGTWSGGPLAYGYQWEDCNSSGVECKAIAGATNPNYTPVSSDVGHKLVAQVTATNGGGSVLASSSPSALVASSGGSTAGEARSPQPGMTVEYGVPVSGSGAPHEMSGAEVAKWAQTDVPVEATAVFPPDEPQGWPASDYRRATVEYLDGDDRDVNTASPGGGIVTSEYNSYGDVTRNLSADDREAALKEGSKSAEVSQTLDTQNTYGGEGTELSSTLGPLHSIKLASGATVQARKHTVLSYDEGAPELGGPYRLVTKVTEGAQISGEPEADVRTTTKSYAGQNNLGWTLRKPTSTKVDPSGLKLVNSTVYDPTSGNVTETRTPGANSAGEEVLPPYVYKTSFGAAGTERGQFSNPTALAIDSEGNIWVVDTANDRVEEFSSSGTFIHKFGEIGLYGYGRFKEPQGIAIDGNKDIWVTDTGNKLIQIYSDKGIFVGQFELPGAAKPTALAYSPNAEGGEGLMYVIVSNKVVAYNTSYFEAIYSFGASGTGNGQLKSPKGIAIDAHGNVWVTDTGNNRVQEFDEYGTYMKQFGTAGTGNGQFKEPSDITFDNEDNIFVTDAGNNRVQAFTASGAYRYQFGEAGTGEGQFKAPAALALDKSNNAYVLDTGNDRVEKWQATAALHESGSNGGTHGVQTIYYTTAANAEVPGCGARPEWAGLPCERRPAAQPETSGLPNLPVTTITYNLWDEPLVSTETVGTTTRTNTNVYDEAGRLINDTVSSTIGTSLPSVAYEYNSETGDQTKVSTTVGGTTTTLESVYDKRGELSSYKDADGNTSTFTYDPYGRLESANDGKGTQTYTYDTTTGLLSKLADSAAGTFTASYDEEGNLKAVAYPNGMNVNHAYDATGSETGVEYVKTTHCSTGCVWYSQTESPSVHDQTLSRSSTLSSQAYTYDAAGRLTQTQDTPAGEGCTTRIYSYDEETNITSLISRPPGSGGKCATEEGTIVNHSYDTANRLTDSGIGYDALGDITKLPAADAGGSELTSTFYADETLATQTQNGQTLGYYLDPSGRDRQIVSTGKTSSTVTYHYAGEGRAPSWTEETSGKWTRNIYGFEGLVATQNGGEAPVLQIQDLRGDVVGTASLSETATGLLSKGDQTEYGVPRTSSPPRYSWQGALALRTELPSGVIAMGARSYVPSMGRFLQPDPIEGGSANEYAYTYGDPVNTADPTGEYTVETPSWVRGFLNEQAEIATEAAIQRAAEEQAAREEAEEKALEALEEAAEAAEAWTEVRMGGGIKGNKGKGKVAGADLLSASRSCTWSGICSPSQIKTKCDRQCKDKRNKAEEKRKEKRKEEEETSKRIHEELECGHLVSGYRPGVDTTRIDDGLYYGYTSSKNVSCGSDGGDPTAPCIYGDCEDGFEAWQQWSSHQRSRRPRGQPAVLPRTDLHMPRA